MRDIFTILKKELKSIFTDKAILFQVVFIPFIIVFGYSMLMSVLSDEGGDKENEKVVAYSVNVPEYMKDAIEDLGIEDTSLEKIEDYRKDISKKKCDLIVVFPEDFHINMENTEKISNIEIWYNSSEIRSTNLYTDLSALLSGFQPVAFTVNADADVSYDLGDPDFTKKKMLGTIMPLMLIMGVFTVCMNIAAESIAGDKERGFLNTILITPVSRRNVASGKAAVIFIVAIIAGISAFVGLALGLPKFSKAIQATEVIKYSGKEYIILFLVTITAIFAMSSILLIVSTLSSSVKQATTIAPVFFMIIMILAMLRTVESFDRVFEKFGRGNSVIPIWNSMDVLQKIVQMDFNTMDALLTCGVNVLFTILSLIIIGKIFENDNIVNG